jgi:hypothetical protein
VQDLPIEVHGDGNVVASFDFGVDRGPPESVLQTGGGAVVVDPPADVLGLGLEPVAPPAIGHRIGMEGPEGVDPPRSHEAVHPASLFGEVPGALLILLGPGEVDGLVGDVVVPAEDDFLSGGLLVPGPVGHGVAEPEFVADPGPAVLAVGKVGPRKDPRAEVEGQEPALGVVLGNPEAGDRQGLVAAVHGHSAVALLFGLGPPDLPTGPVGEVGPQLFGPGLGFLEADDVGPAGLQPGKKALFGAGPDAVDVPRHEFHGFHSTTI